MGNEPFAEREENCEPLPPPPPRPKIEQGASFSFLFWFLLKHQQFQIWPNCCYWRCIHTRHARLFRTIYLLFYFRGSCTLNFHSCAPSSFWRFLWACTRTKQNKKKTATVLRFYSFAHWFCFDFWAQFIDTIQEVPRTMHQAVIFDNPLQFFRKFGMIKGKRRDQAQHKNKVWSCENHAALDENLPLCSWIVCVLCAGVFVCKEALFVGENRLIVSSDFFSLPECTFSRPIFGVSLEDHLKYNKRKTSVVIDSCCKYLVSHMKSEVRQMRWSIQRRSASLSLSLSLSFLSLSFYLFISLSLSHYLSFSLMHALFLSDWSFFLFFF